MDRLTRRINGVPYIRSKEGSSIFMRDTDLEAVRRLAAYEDTGLTPEEIKKIATSGARFCESYNAFDAAFSFSHIKELLNAEADGRLIVLPCKVGDKFYTLEKYCSDGQDDRIKTRHWGSDCDDHCCTYPCDAEIRVAEWKWASPIRILQEKKRIGKDIFLTREEAEATLEEKK